MHGKLIFDNCKCTVDCDVGESGLSLILKLLHVCGHLCDRTCLRAFIGTVACLLFIHTHLAVNKTSLKYILESISDSISLMFIISYSYSHW